MRAATVDVAEHASVEALIAGIVATEGRLDCAFNNAGIGLGAVGAAGRKLADVEEPAWDRMIAVNPKGVWLAMKHELRVMARGAAIVKTASIAGFAAMPSASPYVAAKHGVIGLSRAAAVDYGPAGIRINALCPGYVETPLTGHVSAERRKTLAEMNPLRRLARPEEIAEQAIWALCDRSGYLNGAAIPVDGGCTAT